MLRTLAGFSDDQLRMQFIRVNDRVLIDNHKRRGQPLPPAYDVIACIFAAIVSNKLAAVVKFIGCMETKSATDAPVYVGLLLDEKGNPFSS